MVAAVISAMLFTIKLVLWKRIAHAHLALPSNRAMQKIVTVRTFVLLYFKYLYSLQVIVFITLAPCWQEHTNTDARPHADTKDSLNDKDKYYEGSIIV